MVAFRDHFERAVVALAVGPDAGDGRAPGKDLGHDALGTAWLASFCPCTYLSTVAVVPSARRSEAARALYGELIEHSEQSGDVAVVTHTWSTNTGHLGLLDELGFKVALRVADHRGPGVDTVYFARPAEPRGTLAASTARATEHSDEVAYPWWRG